MSIEQSLEEISTNAANTVDVLTSLSLVIDQMAANVEIQTNMMVETHKRMLESEKATDEGNQAVVIQPDPDPEPEQAQPDIDPKQVNVYLQRVSANLPGGKPAIRKIMEALDMTGGLGGATQDQLRDLIVEVDKQVAAAQNSFE